VSAEASRARASFSSPARSAAARAPRRALALGVFQKRLEARAVRRHGRREVHGDVVRARALSSIYREVRGEDFEDFRRGIGRGVVVVVVRARHRVFLGCYAYVVSETREIRDARAILHWPVGDVARRRIA